MAQENTLVIDNQEYKTSDLTPEATTQLTNIQVTDQEIARQESLLAMLRTARAAYGQKLAEALKDIKPKAKPAAKKAAVNDKPAAKTAAKAKPAAKAKTKN